MMWCQNKRRRLNNSLATPHDCDGLNETNWDQSREEYGGTTLSVWSGHDPEAQDTPPPSTSNLGEDSRTSASAETKEVGTAVAQAARELYSTSWPTWHPMSTIDLPQTALKSSRNLQEEVCFGEIRDIALKLRKDANHGGVNGMPVHLHPDRIGDVVSSTGKPIAILDSSLARSLETLGKECGITLQLRIYQEAPQVYCAASLPRPSHLQRRLYLSAIVYGNMTLFDDVGSFLQNHELFLQDPCGCDRNVPYRNPHLLSGSDDVVEWTYDLDITDYEAMEQRPDLLDGLQTDEVLPESLTPPALQTPLYSHQKQALSFMKRKEQGWTLQNNMHDLWSAEELGNEGLIYTNNITGESQNFPPPQMLGGIIADEMGLGKSLTILSLVALDVAEGNKDACYPFDCSETTLLVVPSSLVQQWEDQIIEHTHNSGPSIMRWTKHYGSSKIESMRHAREHHVVITSFQTLATEYRRHKGAPSILFQTQWKRIVLDEAHTIRNQSTVTARAAYDLRAQSRWAITGTPLQNRLADFTSLLRFLRVYPYDDPKLFARDVTNLWKQGEATMALARFKHIFKCIAIRRLRSSLTLPSRKDKKVLVHFTPGELEAYRKIENPLAQSIEAELRSERRQPKAYMHALIRINNLRKFCNVADNTSKTHIATEEKTPVATSLRYASEAQSVLDDMIGSGSAICAVCASEISSKIDEDSDLGSETPGDVYLTECMRVICNECFCRAGLPAKGLPEVCSDHSACSVAIATTRSIATPHGDLSMDLLQPQENALSSKVMSLMADLQSTRVEKSVVFSSWTTTLAMVEAMLISIEVPYVRVDGEVPIKLRAARLHRFRADPEIQVILMTLRCGGEGLNLTSASRVYLMEPQWNPNIEEQAMSRVHRLGQTRPVTTIRLVVKDTIEDHVMNIQDRKKELADLLLSEQRTSSAQRTTNRLQCLRNLLN